MTINLTAKRPQTHLESRFNRKPLGELLRSTGSQGYSWTEGIHIYSELRPIEGLVVTSSVDTSQRFLGLLEDYIHAGLQAGMLFQVSLFEAQGTVLHFHLEGELNEDTFKRAMSFCYVFTKTLYDGLADEMRSEWNGFALCMDHGPAVVIKHGNTSSSSTISLGEAANRPAKRLLYGRTKSGFVEHPSAWKDKRSEGWAEVNLRDRATLPLLRDYESSEVEEKLRQTLRTYRANRIGRPPRSIFNVSANAHVDRGAYTTDRPLLVNAACMRADLDGFSKQVKAAFEKGPEAVEAVAMGFVKIMEFGDFFEKSYPGAIRLPWAGDCATFLFPPGEEVTRFRGKDWIKITEGWQTFASSNDVSKARGWAKVFPSLSWAVGMTYAGTGDCLVAPVQALDRNFLIGAGIPLALAQDAQNQGAGGDIVITHSDYTALYPPVQKLFQRLSGTDFWVGQKLTTLRVGEVMLHAGKSEYAKAYVEKLPTIAIVPSPKPYC